MSGYTGDETRKLRDQLLDTTALPTDFAPPTGLADLSQVTTPDLVAALQKLVFEWGNRGERTSLEVWNNRMKAAVAEAHDLITKATQA